MKPRRSSRVTYEVIDGQAVLLDPDGVELLTLNRVGTLVWEALDGHHDAAELAGVLIDQLDGVTLVQLERDIRAFFDEIVDARLVDVGDAGG
jgi:hypothetical protein